MFVDESKPIRWQTIVNEARERSLSLEQGDPVPHGQLSSTLVDLGHAQSNTEATSHIERAVNRGALDASPGEFADEYLPVGAEYIQIESGVYPTDLMECSQWLITEYGSKRPHAHWQGDTGPVDYTDEDNWTDFDTARDYAKKVGRYDLAFSFSSKDDFVFIDFDDVRDPDTGEIDPGVENIIRRADSYADVSTSGTGVHLIVRGRLSPENKTLMGSFGENRGDIEVYEKSRFCVMTGEHLAETPRGCTPAQEVIDELEEEYGSIPESVPDEAIEPPQKEREELEMIESTGNEDDIWDAIKQVRPGDIRLKSKVTNVRQDGSKDLDPSWEHSESGTRIGQFSDGWVYRKGMIGLDALQIVALEERIISSPDEYPRGNDYWAAVDALRDRGALIPRYRSEGELQLPTGALGDVSDLSLEEIREQARQEGRNWPTTEEVMNRVGADLYASMRRAENVIIKAPTASRKTTNVAKTSWKGRNEVTGGEPVVTFYPTRKSRDEAKRLSDEYRTDSKVLKGRKEICDAAAGKLDQSLNITGSKTISEWLDHMCDDKKIPFTQAHARLDQAHKAETGEPLPCGCHNNREKEESQWDDVPRNEDGEVVYDSIIATQPFANVPKLIKNANVIFDEQPNFELGMDSADIKEMTTSLLRHLDASVQTWEELIVNKTDRNRYVKNEIRQSLQQVPDEDWLYRDPDAHALAPVIARAIFNAELGDNGRLYGVATQDWPIWMTDPPEDWEGPSVHVVVNSKHDISKVYVVPPLHLARCVIGLDAHPSEEQWEMNTRLGMEVRAVLREDEARLWRLFERGLFVIQIGTADRPLTNGEYFNEERTRVLLKDLHDHFGELRTAVTTKAVEDRVSQIFEGDLGVDGPAIITIGNEKSRNDFADETVGVVLGCVDPGDDNVLDFLTLLEGQARPERSDTDCDDCGGTGCTSCDDTGKKRAHGRGFVGQDADQAEELLESVRAKGVAQGVGRYARKADAPEEFTLVFVWSDVLPDELVDMKISDVRPLTETQEEVIEFVRSAEGGATTREIAAEIDITKEGARKTLAKLAEIGRVSVDEGAGKYGANVYDVDRSIRSMTDLSPRSGEVAG
jgi:hypothetical protein